MIRITFVTDNQRTTPEEFDTDDLAEALAAWALRHLRLKPREEGKPHSDNRGPDKWVLGFVIERDGERYGPGEIAGTLATMASLERVREVQR